MPCTHVKLPNGITAIVCASKPRMKRCSCGGPGTLLCDWKIDKAGKTCDRAICSQCTQSPVEGKDICPAHQLALEEWQVRRAKVVA